MSVKIIHNKKSTQEHQDKSLIFDVELSLRRMALICNKMMESLELVTDEVLNNNTHDDEELSKSEIMKYQLLLGKSDSIIDATMKIAKTIEKIDSIARKYNVKIEAEHSSQSVEEMSDADILVLQEVVKNHGIHSLKKLSQVSVNQTPEAIEIVKEFVVYAKDGDNFAILNSS